MLRFLRSLSLALAAAGLLAPAAANAAPTAKVSAATSKKASKKKATKKPVYPTVDLISPRKLSIGDKLTVKGKHFLTGKGKNSVAFYATGKAVVFAKADSATSTKLVVTIPAKVANLLVQKDGAPVPTMLRLRVVAAKMGRTWTKNSRSPHVAPLPGAPIGSGGAITEQQAAAIAYLSCQQQAAAAPGADADADGLTNGTELQYKLDPCTNDTDGDAMTDGYEFWSAVDLNGAATPYPGKRPWPNPLDPTDAKYDFDGDGLYMSQEYGLWNASGTGFPLTQYSDGSQNSGGVLPVVTPDQQLLDLDGDGKLTDDERDVDGDGLSNVIEFNMRGTQAWWNQVDWHFKPHDPTATSYVEPAYTLRAFSDLDATDPDTDGDGIPDGADDQDNDGWSNFVEMQLTRAETGYRVQPFNPCLPDPHASVCSRYVPFGMNPWPPFDKIKDNIYSGMPGDAIPFAWPVVNYQAWVTAGSPDPASAGGVWAHPTPWFTAGWDGVSGS